MVSGRCGLIEQSTSHEQTAEQGDGAEDRPYISIRAVSRRCPFSVVRSIPRQPGAAEQYQKESVAGGCQHFLARDETLCREDFAVTVAIDQRGDVIAE